MKKPPIFGVYAIQHDMCLYIGSSKNIVSRWNSHCNLLSANSHHCRKLQDCFNNSNKNFSKLNFIILQQVDPHLNLMHHEHAWILRARQDGFTVFNKEIYSKSLIILKLPSKLPAYFTKEIIQFNSALMEI